MPTPAYGSTHTRTQKKGTKHTAAGHSWCPYFGQRNTRVHRHAHTQSGHSCLTHASPSSTRRVRQRERNIEKTINRQRKKGNARGEKYLEMVKPKDKWYTSKKKSVKIRTNNWSWENWRHKWNAVLLIDKDKIKLKNQACYISLLLIQSIHGK